MMSRQCAGRLAGVIPIILAISAGLPGQAGFPSITVGLAQHTSSAGDGTRLRLEHNGSIAFLLGTPTTAWIETVNPDGTGIERLTQACGSYMCLIDEYAWSPQILDSWSPDGRHILYFRVPWNVSRGPRATALRMMNANGT